MSLRINLSTLEASGLIQLSQSSAEVEYEFRHALVQDAAYATLLKQDRARVHALVGRALERSHRGQLSEWAPKLAIHFREAGIPEKAFFYHKLAGDTAFERYANEEAAGHFRQAMAFQEGGLELTIEQLTTLYTRLGRALELNSKFEEALETYNEMERVAMARAMGPLQLEALILQGKIRSTPNELRSYPAGLALAEKAMALAQQLGDLEAEARIQWNLVNLFRMTERFDEALVSGQRAIELAEALDLKEVLAFTSHDLSHVHEESGQIDQALVLQRKAGRLWRELGNLPMLADSLSTGAASLVFLGEYDEALRLSDEAYQISLAIQNLWGQSYSRYWIGRIYWDRGRPDLAISTMEQSIDMARQAGFMVPLVITRAFLGLFYSELGVPDKARQLVAEALQHANHAYPLASPLVLACAAMIHLERGETSLAADALGRAAADRVPAHFTGFYIDLAEACLSLASRDFEAAWVQAVQLAELLHQRSYWAHLPDALLVQAQALFHQDKLDEAARVYQKCHKHADDLGAVRIIWQVDYGLSQIERRKGHEEAAERLRQQAIDIVMEIGRHAAPLGLRESYLDTDPVRRLIRPY